VRTPAFANSMDVDRWVQKTARGHFACLLRHLLSETTREARALRKLTVSTGRDTFNVRFDTGFAGQPSIALTTTGDKP
jgi:hypothetical protein